MSLSAKVRFLPWITMPHSDKFAYGHLFPYRGTTRLDLLLFISLVSFVSYSASFLYLSRSETQNFEK